MCSFPIYDDERFPETNESMVSLVLRQYMRDKNGTESLVGFFSNVVVQWHCGLSCLFE